MSFRHPELLWWLSALAPFPWLAVRHFRRRIDGFLSLAGESTGYEAAELRRAVAAKSVRSAVGFGLGCALALIGLADPLWGERLVAEYRLGVDAALAFDLSRSMDATDSLPSRLERAKLIARRLTENSPGIRFAVAIGKGAGVLAVPLSDDAEAVRGLADAVTSLSMTAPGSDLESLVDAALTAFPESSAARRLIVLFTDGDELAGDASAAADRAREAGCPIAVVGLGGADGAPVPAAPGVDAYLTDADGRTVRSPQREAVLRRIAERSGGAYFSGDAASAAADLSAYLAARASPAAGEGSRREPRSWRAWCLVLALAAWAFGRFSELPPRRSAP